MLLPLLLLFPLLADPPNEPGPEPEEFEPEPLRELEGRRPLGVRLKLMGLVGVPPPDPPRLNGRLRLAGRVNGLAPLAFEDEGACNVVVELDAEPDAPL